jgi:hypothetical protein
MIIFIRKSRSVEGRVCLLAGMNVFCRPENVLEYAMDAPYFNAPRRTTAAITTHAATMSQLSSQYREQKLTTISI